MMENEKENDPEGWIWIHLLRLQRGHRAPHPVPLRLHFGGFLSRVVLVLLGDHSPRLDPTSGGEMLSLAITSRKVCVYKFFPSAVPMKRKIYSTSGSSQTQSWKGHTRITELFHRQCLLKYLFLGGKRNPTGMAEKIKAGFSFSFIFNY